MELEGHFFVSTWSQTVTSRCPVRMLRCLRGAADVPYFAIAQWLRSRMDVDGGASVSPARNTDGVFCPRNVADFVYRQSLPVTASGHSVSRCLERRAGPRYLFVRGPCPKPVPTVYAGRMLQAASCADTHASPFRHVEPTDEGVLWGT